jgi:hypothetical protein
MDLDDSLVDFELSEIVDSGMDSEFYIFKARFDETVISKLDITVLSKESIDYCLRPERNLRWRMH